METNTVPLRSLRTLRLHEYCTSMYSIHVKFLLIAKTCCCMEPPPSMAVNRKEREVRGG